ncbi:MAG TPA: glycosyltransferase [Solirubrobacterales bacterium]|nr:glycosyltransferase [Solirubrobacterales bacterium]
MRIVIANSRFLLGGSETYAVTVGEQLERLGHEVSLFAGEASPEGRGLASSRGLPLATGSPDELAERDDFDALIAQDAAVAYAVAGRRQIPQVFVIHGLASFEHPPQRLSPALRVVALSDRIADRAATLAGGPEVVRMRQPIDIWRFKPTSPARERPRRVLAFSNYLPADRLAMLEAACTELGLVLTSMGATSEASLTPQQRIADADIVVGYGRSVLEGMAAGRAVYVWDHSGGDGWVTGETYPDLEADGFAAGATETIVDVERLCRDFAAYRRELGPLGYDLVRKHHSAARHAEEMVSLLERAEAPAVDPVNATFGILIRSEWRAEDDRIKVAAQLRTKAAEAAALQARLEEVGAAGDIERRRRLVAEQKLQETDRTLQDLMGSASWRLTAPLRRLTTALRSLLGR